VAARLGHTSTRMVEKHYVSLFEGLDGEIGERLGSMRELRQSESARLRLDRNGDQMGTKRGPMAGRSNGCRRKRRLSRALSW